jgi:hypothetical protein
VSAAPPAWSLPALARAAVIAAIALGAGATAGWAVAHERPPARPTAGADVRALLAPLAPGSRLGAFEVAAVGAVTRGTIRIELTRGTERRVLGIASAPETPGPPRPALTVGPYALFYFGAEGGDVSTALAALAEVLRANVAVPVPAGLAPLRP